MPITVAKVWRPYVRKVIAASKGDYTGLIFRDRHVTRKSKTVMAINEVFKKCAETYGHKGLSLKEYQSKVGQCVKENWRKG